MFRTFQMVDAIAGFVATSAVVVVALTAPDRWVNLLIAGAVVMVIIAGIKRFLVDSYDAGYRAGMRAARRNEERTTK